MTVALQANGLGFAFPGAGAVLRDVSFALRSGEMVALIGPNGAGKSTLLRRVAGLLPGPGQVHYGADDAASLSLRALAQRRAVVPQQEGAVVPYSVGHMVAQGLAHRHRRFVAPGAAQVGREVQAVLQELAFEPGPQRLFAALSGGERQLVLVARALVQGAQVMLLDEPQSRLDLRHRAAVMQALHRRVRRGAAVLTSLHDLNLAALTCDRLLLLHNGQLVAQGPAQEVLQPALLQRVYGTAVRVWPHPQLGVPMVELDLAT